MRDRSIRVEDPFTIGPWRVDARKNLLERGAHRVRIEPKAMRVLVHLALRAGEDVSREDILRAVWGSGGRSAHVLTNAVWELRKAFGDDSSEPDFIQTVPKRGYRLVAPVDVGSNGAGKGRGIAPIGRLSKWLASIARARKPTDFLEGERAALLRILRCRFGVLSDEWVRRLQALDSSKKLDAYLDRAASARSLKELEIDGRKA